MSRATRCTLSLLLACAEPLTAQALPPLPDTSGFGVHVLALARAPDGAIWVGTYGQGIFVFRPGAGGWEQLRHSSDTAARSISWDFVHAFGFGPGGTTWYGTVGNGWGRSSDGGKTWTNWGFTQLGPQWQYVAPNGIVTRGDTVYIGTADGIRLSWDQGASWAEITDSAGGTTAQNSWGRLRNQYVLALAAGPDGSLWASHLHGLARSQDGGRTWTEFPTPVRCADPRCANRVRALAPDDGGVIWAGTERGLYRLDPARNAWLDKRARPACPMAPVVKGCRVDMPAVQALHRAGTGHVYAATRDGMYEQDGNPLSRCDLVAAATSVLPLAPGWYATGRPSPSGLSSCRFDQGLSLVGVSYGQRPDSVFEGKRHTWFKRPIALADQPYIDQTYRYGSTMGGNFQQHQGVEFNNPNGTPVHAIGDGVVVFAGAADQGANTVALRHDRTLGGLFIYSVYYHNTALRVFAGQRVQTGDVIATVGNTGRATNDHLHLEVHAAPQDSVLLVVDPNQRYPKYTVNPELWIEPLPGTGIVAGQVWDARGRPVPQARVYGLIKAEPQETPFSFAETYGERSHPDPAYREHFAVSDVEPGEYTLAVLVDGKRVSKRIRVEAGRVTWVVFGSGAH